MCANAADAPLPLPILQSVLWGAFYYSSHVLFLVPHALKLSFTFTFRLLHLIQCVPLLLDMFKTVLLKHFLKENLKV